MGALIVAGPLVDHTARLDYWRFRRAPEAAAHGQAGHPGIGYRIVAVRWSEKGRDRTRRIDPPIWMNHTPGILETNGLKTYPVYFRARRDGRPLTSADADALRLCPECNKPGRRQ